MWSWPARSADKLGEAVAAFTAEGFGAEALDAGRRRRGGDRRGSGGARPVRHAGQQRRLRATRPRDRDHAGRISTPSLGLNIRGAYFLTHAVARGLIAAGKPGSLINISSQMGHVGGVDRPSIAPPSTRSKASPRRWRSSGGGTAFASTHSARPSSARRSRRRPSPIPSGSVAEEKIKLGRVGLRRGHHGRGRLSGLRRVGNGDGHGADGRRRMDGGADGERKGDIARRGEDGPGSASRRCRASLRPARRRPSSTIEKVRRAADELGYRPNVLARSLITGPQPHHRPRGRLSRELFLPRGGRAPVGRAAGARAITSWSSWPRRRSATSRASCRRSSTIRSTASCWPRSPCRRCSPSNASRFGIPVVLFNRDQDDPRLQQRHDRQPRRRPRARRSARIARPPADRLHRRVRGRLDSARPRARVPRRP